MRKQSLWKFFLEVKSPVSEKESEFINNVFHRE